MSYRQPVLKLQMRNLDNTTPTSSLPYVTNCAGWYVVSADVSAKRYLYINGTQSPYCLPSNGHCISVFLGKGDSIYWNGALSTINSQKFISARGCKYKKTAQKDLEDLFS